MPSFSARPVTIQRRSCCSMFATFSRSFLLLVRTRDREVSADLTAEAFAVALNGVDHYDPAKGTPQQWLYGIANTNSRQCGGLVEWPRGHGTDSRSSRRRRLSPGGRQSRRWKPRSTATGSPLRWPGCPPRAARRCGYESSSSSITARLLAGWVARAGRHAASSSGGLRRLREEFSAPLGGKP